MCGDLLTEVPDASLDLTLVASSKSYSILLTVLSILLLLTVLTLIFIFVLLTVLTVLFTLVLLTV